MKITILTVGSRGDVQPYLALGVGLHNAGYSVKFATHDTFNRLACLSDLRRASIGRVCQRSVTHL